MQERWSLSITKSILNSTGITTMKLSSVLKKRLCMRKYPPRRKKLVCNSAVAAMRIRDGMMINLHALFVLQSYLDIWTQSTIMALIEPFTTLCMPPEIIQMCLC